MSIVDQIMALCSQQNVQLSLNGEQLEVAFDEMPGQDLILLLREHKQAVCQFLQQQTGVRPHHHAISRLKTQTGPLSPTQQRMWFASQYAPDSTQNNICCQLLLHGEIDIPLFEATLQHIVKRHEILRTGYDAKEPFQFVRADAQFYLKFVDLRQDSAAQPHQNIDELFESELNRPFDLQHDVLLRAMLVQTGEQKFSLGVVLHHIAADGWSLQVLSEEVVRIYSQLKETGHPTDAELPVQYLDYAYWAQEHRDLYDEALQYWQEQLRGAPLVHSLPMDYDRPAYQQYDARQHSVQLDPLLSAQLNQLCQRLGVTPFMFLYTVFGYFISRWSNQTDVVLGTPVAGRTRPELEGMIGCFVNTLVLRNQFDSSDFVSLLAKTREQLIAAYQHQDMPFDVLVEKINPQRSSQILPLVQIFFTFHNLQQQDAVFHLPGCSMQFVQQIQAATKADLEFSVVELQGQYVFEWNYATSLFSGATISRYASSFSQLLQFMIQCPAAPLIDAPLLPPEDLARLQQWQDGPVVPVTTDLLPDRLAVTARQRADDVALHMNEQQLSYRELHTQVSQLARYLQQQYGIGPGSRVAVCLQPSCSMMVAILAVLQAGAAYVPLDPLTAVNRLRYICQDSGARLLLTTSDPGMSALLADVVCLDSVELQEQLASYPAEPLRSDETGLRPEHLAYIIYTSGSTGQPKGVKVGHRQLNNYIEHCIAHYYPQQSASVLSTSLAFDASVTVLLPQLCIGLPCTLMPAANLIAELASHLMRAQVAQVFKLTPAHLVALTQQLSQAIPLFNSKIPHCFVVGGERLLHGHCQAFMHFFPAAKLFNEYGPTETTVGCSYVQWQAQGDDAAAGVSIGRPLHNTRLLVLDPAMQPLPIGVVGELYIGGSGVTDGYCGSESLTATRFLSDPNQPDMLLYRSGDLVYWQQDGSLSYVGRNDGQLKIRGYRVEAGEIEQALTECEGILDAAVVARDGADGQKILVAYLVTSPQVSEAGTDLRTALQSRLSQWLPEYMVPDVYVPLPQLPLTANGKIDRQALLTVEYRQQQFEHQAPVSREEMVLAQIWCEVLGVKQVGRTDNFFALGGHSILALQVAAKLLEHGIKLDPKDIFAHATLSALAAVLKPVAGGAADSASQTPAGLPPGLTRITPDLLPLASLSQQDIDHIVSTVEGGVQNIKDIYMLGPLQQGILFHHITSTAADPYVRPLTFRLEHSAALKQFIDGIQFVIDRHDVLRTQIAWQGLPQQVQVVLHQASLPVQTRQFDDLATLELYLQQFIRQPQRMDLQRAPLIELEVASVATLPQHYVLLRFHHIIADHIGMEILSEELAGFLFGQSAQLAPALPYRDFIAHVFHQQQQLDARSYFQSRLAGLDGGTLMFGLEDIYGDGQQLTSAATWLSDQQSQQIKILCKQLAISPAVLFHAAWAMVVSLCSGRHDIVFGTVASGRMQSMSDVGHMMGVFINTVPLRLNLKALSAPALLQLINAEFSSLMAYEQTPLPQALGCADVAGPLFNALLNYRHSRQAATGQGDGYSMLSYHESTNYPVELLVDDFGDRFAFEVQVRQPIAANELLHTMTMSLDSLLELLTQNADTEVLSVSLVSAQSRQQQLIEWNATAQPFSADCCIHQLFETAVRSQPLAIAAESEAGVLTYQQLNARANQLAHWLRAEHHIQPDMRVGICMQRSQHMLIAILAILKAGGAYVPLDPAFPAQRLQYMQQDAGVSLVLTQQALLQMDWTCAVLCVDHSAVQQMLASYSEENPGLSEIGLQPHHLAYLLYTSGSTGMPKGVMIEHRALVNRLQWMQRQFNVSARDVILQKTPYSFDVSVWELLLPLICGARLVLASPDGHKDPQYLADLIRTAGVTMLHFVPAMFGVMLQSGLLQTCAGIRTVICSGEALGAHLVDSFSQQCPSAELYNLYGPTEATIDVTYWRCEPGHPNVPIGKPIDNTQVLVLNDAGMLLPTGCVGELCLAGVGLARGYLNRPGLNQEKFVACSLVPQQRIYRTGDLARWRPDGVLEYLGRADQQVKINGWRIEPAEIDQALCTLPMVQAAVTLAKDLPGGQSLVSYLVVTESAAAVSNAVLREMLQHELSRLLPGPLVPSIYVLVDQIPLTPSGKVNRAALPMPDLVSGTTAQSAPADQLEVLLCDIWRQVLAVEAVGVHDHFFACGGDSVKALQLVAKLNRYYPALTVRSVFERPTPAELATLIREQWPDAEQAACLPFSAWQQVLWTQQVQTRRQLHAISQQWLQLETAQLQLLLRQLIEKYELCRLQVDRTKPGLTLPGIADKNRLVAGLYEAVLLPDQVDLDSAVMAAIDTFASQSGQFRIVLMSHRSYGCRLLVQADALCWDQYSWLRVLEDIAELVAPAKAATKSAAAGVSTIGWHHQQLGLYQERQWQHKAYWQDKLTSLAVAEPRPSEALVSTQQHWHFGITPATVDWQLMMTSLKLSADELCLLLSARAFWQWQQQVPSLVNMLCDGRQGAVECGQLLPEGNLTQLVPVLLPQVQATDVDSWILAVKEQFRQALSHSPLLAVPELPDFIQSATTLIKSSGQWLMTVRCLEEIALAPLFTPVGMADAAIVGSGQLLQLTFSLQANHLSMQLQAQLPESQLARLAQFRLMLEQELMVLSQRAQQAHSYQELRVQHAKRQVADQAMLDAYGIDIE